VKVDERFMTIMTAMFLIVGVGAMMQRGEDGSSLLGGGGSFEPRPDTFTVRAGRTQPLDVLLNDSNPERADIGALQIVTAPACGSATIVEGAVEYSSPADCSGTIELAYCLPFEGKCRAVPVTLKVISTLQVARDTTSAPLAPASEIAAARPQDRVDLRQPMRLTLPTESEVITPSEATAEVRRMAESTPTVAQQDDAGHDANITVSRTSARSGSVSVAGAEMAAPDPVTDSSGVAIASASGIDRDPRRSAAPMGLATANPARIAPAFQAPMRPDAADPQVMASIPSMPTIPLPTAPTVPTAPQSAQLAETAAPADDAAPVAAPQVADMGAPVVDDSSPVAGGLDVAAATTSPMPAPAPNQSGTETAGLGAPTMQESAAAAPDLQADSGRIVAGVDSGPALGASDQVAAMSAPDSAPETVLPAADAAQAPVTAPAAPAETEVALAPDAQTSQPAQAAAPEPEERSLIASLARSNTVLGATVSAAKALFGPDEPSATEAAKVASTPAPRPKEITEVTAMDLNAGAIEEVVGKLPAATDDARPESGDRPMELAALAPREEGSPYQRRTEQALTPLQMILNGEASPEAPAAEAPETEVAALSQDGAEPALPEAGTAPAATGLPAPEAEDDKTRVAALPPAAAVPTLDLPDMTTSLAIAPDCGIDLSMQVQVGAELVVSLSSPCRPSQAILVDHAGLVFSAETDDDGVANFVVPAMQTNAIVRVSFPDGGSAVDRATVEGMSRMSRVAVIWTDEVDFDLHVREFGAEPGSDGDIWEGNARDYRTARRSGGGYITLLGPFKGPGARAEVYTIFETLRTDAGQIAFSIEMSAYSDACARQPVIRLLRSEQAHLVDEADLALDTRACDGQLVDGSDFGLKPLEIADAY